MIQKLVQQWDARKNVLKEWLKTEHPGSYKELVEQLVKHVLNDNITTYSTLDPDRVHRIDDGDYQGVEIYLIGDNSYQPDASNYIWFDNYYGSCSGCDTLEGIRVYSGKTPDEDQVKQYMDLALHMVQRMKWLEDASRS